MLVLIVTSNTMFPSYLDTKANVSFLHNCLVASHFLFNPQLKKYLCVPLCLWQVLENYNKGKTALLSAAKIMVSPTEVDLNPESLFMDASTTSQQPTPTVHHRRNSSVRLVYQALLWAFWSTREIVFQLHTDVPLNFTCNDGLVLLNCMDYIWGFVLLESVGKCYFWY